MKKYILAALAAVAAFAFFASAAGLVVNAPVLQVGQTDDLECSDFANVVAWGYNDNTEGGPISNASVQLAADHTCDGYAIFVTLLREDGSKLAGTSVLVDDANLDTSANADDSTYRVPFPTSPRGDEIHGVRLAISQAPGARALP